MSKNEKPTMDQLWDRVPDDPDALDHDAWAHWVDGLSPKARSMLTAAIMLPRLPAEFHGDPGESKSDVIIAWAEKNGIPITTITAEALDAEQRLEIDTVPLDVGDSNDGDEK